METIIIIVIIAIALLVVRDRLAARRRHRKQILYELSRLGISLQNTLEKIEKVKTTTSKINNCSKALDIMDEALAYPEAREVIENIDELRLRVIKIKKVLPVIDYIEKANKHRFKKKGKSELNCLLDALYEIGTNNITDEDFRIAKFVPADTKQMVTIQQIKTRAKELGWDEA